MPEQCPRIRWVTALHVLLCAMALPVLIAISTFAMGSLPSYVDPTSVGAGRAANVSNLGVLVWLCALVASLAVLLLPWRPWVVWFAGLVVAVPLGLDPTLLFVASGVTAATASSKAARRSSLAAAAVGLWVIVRATLRSHSWQTMIEPSAPEHPWIRFLVDAGLTAGLFALAVGAGWAWRTRSARRDAEVRAERAEDDAAGLSAQVGAVAEREQLAREIHDALAHRLSLVSLHANALEEALTSDDPAIAEAARVVRDNAHRSLTDLRELIDALRKPPQASPRMPEPAPLPVSGMADVADVIDSTMAAGIEVNAFVALDDPGSASDLLNHTVFRIVQECLTNVVKHAPGSRAGVDLRAAPGRGVQIMVRNPLPAVPVPATGAGMGLVGMRERVTMLGGTMTAGVTPDGWFEVKVTLPWTARSEGDEDATDSLAQ